MLEDVVYAASQLENWSANSSEVSRRTIDKLIDSWDQSRDQIKKLTEKIELMESSVKEAKAALQLLLHKLGGAQSINSECQGGIKEAMTKLEVVITSAEKSIELEPEVDPPVEEKW